MKNADPKFSLKFISKCLIFIYYSSSGLTRNKLVSIFCIFVNDKEISDLIPECSNEVFSSNVVSVLLTQKFH